MCFSFGGRIGDEPGVGVAFVACVILQIHKNFANTTGLQKDVK